MLSNDLWLARSMDDLIMSGIQCEASLGMPLSHMLSRILCGLNIGLGLHLIPLVFHFYPSTGQRPGRNGLLSSQLKKLAVSVAMLCYATRSYV